MAHEAMRQKLQNEQEQNNGMFSFDHEGQQNQKGEP